MRNQKLVRLMLVLAVGTVGTGARAQAAAPTKAECSTSHASSQELRLDGKLLEARRELRTCSDAACPSALQVECAGWLAEVQQAIPSVEFLLETPPGKQQPKVVLDGQALGLVKQGEPHELNPGAHVFRFELEGHPVQEQTLVIRQGEKRRVLRVQFQEPAPVEAPAQGTPVPVSPSGPPAQVSTVSSRPIPVATYVFGGVALVAAGVGAYLGLDALSKHSDKEDTCAPNCPDEDVDQLKTQLLVSDIAGGVALVSAGIAVYTYLNRPTVTAEKPPSSSVPLRILVAPNTVAVRLSGTF